MKYFPKSRIIPNLISNPGQFNNIDGSPYSGPYYTTFDGKSFTGNSPYDGASRPLILKVPILNPNISTDPNSLNYTRLNSSNTAVLVDPTPFTPTPTVLDYKAGKITRYIARQRNGTQFRIMEISKQNHEDLINLKGGANSSLWKSIAIFWQISGPLHNTKINGITTAGIIDTNQRILDTAEKNFVGIKQYLSNLSQFSK
jgi:hypothetical protein